MTKSNPFSDRLRNPLNETTRKSRRNLLAVSVIGVVIADVGLVPSKISAFGIEFTAENQRSLISLLIVAIAYFCLSFIVYLYSELVAWKLVFHSEELNLLKEEARRPSGEASDEELYLHERARFAYIQTKPAFYMRIVAEVGIPIVFSIYAAIALLDTETSDQSTDKVLSGTDAISTTTDKRLEDVSAILAELVRLGEKLDVISIEVSAAGSKESVLLNTLLGELRVSLAFVSADLSGIREANLSLAKDISISLADQISTSFSDESRKVFTKISLDSMIRNTENIENMAVKIINKLEKDGSRPHKFWLDSVMKEEMLALKKEIAQIRRFQEQLAERGGFGRIKTFFVGFEPKYAED